VAADVVAVLPMFPLGSVLLPGEVLPLHVFEERYRQLVRDCLADDTHEFGVVLIERGNEVGGGDVRREIGVVARMLQVAETEDGRYAVIACGTRRIRVNAWLPDDPYPLADVDDWPDVEGDTSIADLAPVLQRVRRCAALAVELGDGNFDTSAELFDEPLAASYQLVALAPIGQSDRYQLLGSTDVPRRVENLDRLLDDVEALIHFRLADDGPSPDPA
jgi:uncharacterized protein